MFTIQKTVNKETANVNKTSRRLIKSSTRTSKRCPSIAARGEKPYVAKHIAGFLADIDNLVDAQDLIENMREYMDDKIREREDGSSD